MNRNIFSKVGFFLLLTLLQANEGLDYLNTLRAKTGEPIFVEQPNLRASAQNHSVYLQTNDQTGHYEDSNKEGYTGNSAYQRAVKAGYPTIYVAENVSYGTTTVKDSIDGLFSAIYHRFAFLSLNLDEVGIGISDNHLHYTYNMGNSVLTDLCLNDTYSGGTYYKPCADTTKKIGKDDYKGISNTIKASSPNLIIWPAQNSNDIPPVFYEEYPDPLPNHNVSGYPISVEFNTKYFTSIPKVSSFTLEDKSGKPLETITLMDNENDPNERFSSYQFALFPEKRLEWGSLYNAEFIYSYNGKSTTKNWCFVTRSLNDVADRFYRITDDISLTVEEGKTYALYFVPKTQSEILNRISYSYNSDDPQIEFIDNNTISIKMTGGKGRKSIFKLYENTTTLKYTVTLTLANSDTAEMPATASCDYDGDGIADSDDLDDDNDGYTDVDEINAGSNPLDGSSKPLDTDGDHVSNASDLDDDNDGILDIDEIANGLDPLNASDAKEDFDNDGFTNAIEISLGTDIRSATSHPKWIPLIMGDIITFIAA